MQVLGDPVFESLDAMAGRSKVRAPLKRVYEHTSGSQEARRKGVQGHDGPVPLEPRGAWQIDAAVYKPCPSRNRLSIPARHADDLVKVLGIWDGHDSGAVADQDGQLRFAVNEERLTRRKLEVRFPTRSIEACLAHVGLAPDQVDVVAASTSDPAKTLSRWWPASKERYYAVRRRHSTPGVLAALTRAMSYRMTEWSPGPACTALSRLALRRRLAGHGLSRARLTLVDHHAAHAAGAAWASVSRPVRVLTIDGVGDGLSSTISIFRDGRLERVAASTARCSLGVFFEHVTNLLNMRELEDEGKVMALADYAAPIADEKNPLFAWIRVRDGVLETERAGHSLRRALARTHWRYPNEQFAFLAQRVVEHTCVALARDAARLTGLDRLALAGGVVSNIRATRCIRLMPEVKDVYVFPHMGDGGLALGAAVAAAAGAGEPIDLDLSRLDLGPGYATPAIAAALRTAGFRADPAGDRSAPGGRRRLRRGRSSCGFRDAWRTVPGRWGTAACWRDRIARAYETA